MDPHLPADQFRVVRPDGYTIERLPLGHAHDAWHLVFIGWPAADVPVAPRHVRDQRRDPLGDGILIEVIDGSRDDRRGGGHGNDTEAQRHVRIADSGATALRITYLSDDGVIATEDLLLAARAT